MGASEELEGEEPQYTTSTNSDDAGPPDEGTAELGLVRSQNGHGCADLPDKAESEHDPFEVSFDGDGDPMCPRSMPLARKWLLVCIVGLGSLCVTCASSIYTATYAQMNAEFHQSDLIATLGLSTFVLGIALGPLFLGPLSEFYGRRPIYLASWTMFVIWLVPSAVARNTATMVTVRFIDGFAGSAFLSVAGGTVSDVFTRDQIQSPMTIISISPFIGPSLGPLLGGFINYYTNWRWTYYVLIIWAFALLVTMILFAPETYHPIILREKARRLRKETGDERWKAPMEKSTKSIPRTVALSLMRPFQLLTLEPMCLLLSLLSAVLLGVIYLFFGAFPLVFGGNYGFNLWQDGLSFLGIFVGMAAGAATNPVWHRVHRALVRRNRGGPEPEFRLAPSILGAVLVPVGLFWFAWTSFPRVHWILPIIGSGIFGCGTLLVFNGIFTFLVDTYPLYAASALAANSFLRCTFAASFPLFGKQLYQGIGYQWASSLLAFITLGLMPLPYVFFHYGKRLRQRSRFTASSS
ncbi:putative drug proton antiporter yhk8 [Rosellinia necatrix]|uniref:Putative drug proton antiporter yhk8 n=1 Tax=Rosellinia necatrix TaxID=77044 RepID=A0A1W2TUB1_ROSNE|nr:putative drug proton antiporter yhk8 [Rosellinia necatrix]